MFSYPLLDIEELTSVTHEWKKVLVAPNGKHPADPVQMKFPPDTNFQTFLEKSGSRINVTPATRAFNESGEEIFDFDQLLDDEVVYLSKKEDFCRGRHDQASDVIGGYVVKEAIGEGGFGRVVKAVHPETGEIVAIKLINKRSFTEITDADRVFVEIQALRDLSHKHVIKMKDVVDNPKFICFIMEFATNGELRNYVSKKGRLEEDEARSFFEQVIKGVHYCHSKNIVHRDLKLENILLDEENRCKIADFGLSHFVVDNAAIITEGGTQAYLAPEVWNGTSKDSNPFQLDVWALGKDEGLPFDSNISPALKRTITAMLHPEPRKRIRISDLMNDPWLRQVLPWEVHQMPSSTHLSASEDPKFDASLSSSRRSSCDGTEGLSSPPLTIEQAIELDIFHRPTQKPSQGAGCSLQKPGAGVLLAPTGYGRGSPSIANGARSVGQDMLQARLTVAPSESGVRSLSRSKASSGRTTPKKTTAQTLLVPTTACGGGSPAAASLAGTRTHSEAPAPGNSAAPAAGVKAADARRSRKSAAAASKSAGGGSGGNKSER